MVLGPRAVEEALLAARAIAKVWVVRGRQSTRIQSLCRTLQQNDIAVQAVPVQHLNRMSARPHQGMIAEITDLAFHHIAPLIADCYEAGRWPFLLIADRITDTHNIGAMARTAEAVGVDALLVPTYASARMNDQTLKASAGALMHLPICRYRHNKSIIQCLKEHGIQLLAASHNATSSCFDADLSGPVALIMGNEAKGIHPQFLQAADKHIQIPLYGHMKSLNVSVAAGILLYAIRTQRQTLKKTPKQGN